MKDSFPKWHLEIDRFRAFKSTFILEGNIYDLHAYRTDADGVENWQLNNKLDQYLFKYLTGLGYASVVYYNHVDGFYNDFEPQHAENFISLYKKDARLEPITGEDKTRRYRASVDSATQMIRAGLESRAGGAKAFVLTMASQYVGNPANLSDEERQCYSRLFLSSLKPTQVKTPQGDLCNNLLFVLVNKANDVPPWFYLDNPYVKIIQVTKPDKQIRRRFIDSQFQYFLGAEQCIADEIEKHKEKFVDLTDGFKNIELNGLRVLCKQENIPITNIAEAISLYKYGIKENPWDELSDEKLKNAEAFIRERVKGQDAAILQTLDIVKRAASGLAGLQHAPNSGRPKGILFFAGPTGTGKTELAKTLAHLLFGDESACIRFDMSEYQQSHSDQKLLGAPPGYVGYEAGGQLTNAIKDRPFSILLFDEIEKAHPSIFDKFLQILEDGRMTDGQGETVYFSETIIIFTSNLGIYVKDYDGKRMPNVTINMPYEDVKEKILKAIKEYFVLDLGRPEILNRIGNNFVVLDYIRPEIAEQIIESQLGKIRENLREKKAIVLDVSPQALEYITGMVMKNLENGGRGIGNIIEKYFINPLSRYIFDNKVASGSTLTITGITEHDTVAELVCRVN